MPELPEVETVRRGLEPAMTGHRIVSAEIRRPDLRLPFPPNFATRLQTHTVLRLTRRSKYILADLSSGETLIVHLGMSGRVLISTQTSKAEPPAKHDHVVLGLSSGARVIYNDARRFGLMDICATDQLMSHRLLANLGPEPLGNQFDVDALHSALAGRKQPIKAALLDQRNVAGLGNIYVSEALWRAKILPTRPAGQLSIERAQDLVTAIKSVLADAIESGGSSLRDHRQTNGELGYFQHAFAVYDRHDEPCKTPDCRGTIARIMQSGRSSFYCPECQT